MSPELPISIQIPSETFSKIEPGTAIVLHKGDRLYTGPSSESYPLTIEDNESALVIVTGKEHDGAIPVRLDDECLFLIRPPFELKTAFLHSDPN